MNKSEIILPQLSSSSLFVRGAVGLASNQHFNLASWHYQFADRPGSFVRALLDPVLFKGLSALSLRHSSAPANESLPIYSPVASFASSSLSPRRIRCVCFFLFFCLSQWTEKLLLYKWSSPGATWELTASLSLSRRCFSCNTSKGKSICELALKCIHLSQHFHDNAAVTFPVCTSCEDDVMASVRCGVCLSVQESLVTESRDVM